VNPLAGLQTGWVPPSNTVSWQQGMPSGLMGNVLQQPTQQAGLMGGGSLPSLQSVQPGDWSNVAYNMAGRPIQGPYPTAPGLPMPAGVTNGTQSAGGGGIGGTALGILGALAKNPSLLKSGYNALSGLLGPTAADTAAIGPAADAAATETATQLGSMPVASILPAAEPAGLMAGGAPALSEIGTSAVAPAVDAAAADAAAALGGTAAGAAAPAGLAASGSFATGGGAAAGSTASGASLGLAGTAAAVAAPFVAQQLGLMIGDAWTGKNTQGNAAMRGWMQSSGVTYKPNYTNSGQNTFGTNNGLLNASSNPGTFYDKSGKVISPTQAANAIYQWATQNGVNPGDFHPV